MTVLNCISDCVTDVTKQFFYPSADFIVDSSKSQIVGNIYPTLKSLETSTKMFDGMIVGLEAGSIFSEDSIDVSSLSNTKLIKTGSGNDPIVYGRKLQTDWSLTAGQTNTYEASVNMTDWPEAGSNEWCTLFESKQPSSVLSPDDEPKSRQTSIANVELNAGSFYVDYNLGKIYQHPTDSGNPNTNGFAYSFTGGDKDLLDEFGFIQGEFVIDNIPKDNGLVVPNNGTAEKLTIQHGHTHGLYLGINAKARNVTVKKIFNLGSGVSPFVANTNQDGGTFEFKNCTSEQPSEYDRANTGGFYSHKAGQLPYIKGGSIGCTTIGSGTTGGNVQFADTTAAYCRNHTFKECRRGVVVSGSNETFDFTRFWAEGKSIALQNIERLLHTSTLTSNSTVNIRGGAALSYGNSGGLIYINQPGTYNIEYNTLVGDRPDAIGNLLAIAIAHQDAIVNIRNNIISGQTWNIYVYGSITPTVTLEDNVFYDSHHGFARNGVNMTLAQFEASITSASNNIEADPDFTYIPATWTKLNDATANAPEVAARQAGFEYYTGN